MTRKQQEDYEQRSAHLVNWVIAHPLINVHQLCKMAGSDQSGNMHRALSGERLVSRKYIDAMEKILKDYGFTPVK